jgi:hypothetical protein
VLRLRGAISAPLVSQRAGLFFAACKSRMIEPYCRGPA